MVENIAGNKILNQLKKYSKNVFVDSHYIKENSNIFFELDNNSSKKLYQLTITKIAEISASKVKKEKLSVLVAETDEIEFLAGFMAGVIQSVNVFVGDRAWGQQEWQQVFNLVTPDLIFGEPPENIDPTKNVINEETIDIAEEESLIMIPTGGTSGKVKFVMHTWKTLSASVFGFQQYFNCQNINSFCTLPLHHVSGLMQFMRSFLTQGNLIVCSYKAIKDLNISLDRQDYFISLVPTQLQYLIDSNPEWLADFKTVLVGGAPAMRSLLDTARKYNIPIATTYGMTETASGIVTLKPEDFLAGNNSSGRVLPHTEIKIEPEQVSSLNNIGLIKINCTSLGLGYYPHTFTQEFVTDDLGYFDSENYLHLVGRNSQKIITGGENVFPTEVEAAIWSSKLVKDICVIGVEDRQWGQIITAIYVPVKQDLNPNLIKQQIQTQLAKYKQPKSWIAVDRIPRNDRGKINYQTLQAMAAKKKL